MAKDPGFDNDAFRYRLNEFWKLSGDKIRLIQEHYDFSQGSPVFTRKGIYTTRGWTEWTEGFVYGASLLQFDATGDVEFLDGLVMDAGTHSETTQQVRL